MIPRTAAQRDYLETAQLPSVILPAGAVDAQSLIALADLVVSAGGTMNREAVALGTPVYSTFAGRLGGVDEQSVGPQRPIAAIARFEELVDGQRVERRQSIDDDRLEPAGGLGGIGLGAFARFGDDDVDDPECLLVGGGHAHRQRRRPGLVRRSATGSTAQPSGEITE